ncbi:MAG: cupin domain-containing protein [Hydrogenophaga sp.]|uniref:cupin domain-containing protein n=1 Tax=Hydrogenophaga sp. TaxID=1904254 RepID=UPI0026193D8B|nr:cupin domain-containing protein [Hydrogenophaga sp.]MCV0438341.1 cupin domain-containing protein [Hydrogenophaga sp.]
MTMSPSIARPGALSLEQMNRQLVPSPGYRVSPEAPASKHQEEVKRLYGGRLIPLMASAEATGRFSLAALTCPPTACTGKLDLSKDTQTNPWRNPDAIECVFCADGRVEVRYGQNLENKIALGRFDMVSVPANVRMQIVNTGAEVSRTVNVLSVSPGGSYDAIFDASLSSQVEATVARDLGIRFDDQAGDKAEAALVEGRVTRFETLVPYKKDLNRTSGLPPEATEALSAGNVFPLIVPEGHVGRSRTAPMYGNQGLYISIAECKAGTDGPPPHAHSDTQESFYVLDGTFDMFTGFDNESVVKVKPDDLIAMPSKVMRTFANTTGRPARLLVIIQGPDRMSDTVSFSRDIGEDFKKRFGDEIIEKYSNIRMTFDAEERAGV